MVNDSVKETVAGVIQCISKAQISLDGCRLAMQTIEKLCNYSDSAVSPLTLNFEVADKINNAILELYSAFGFVKANRDALKGECNAEN